MQPLEQLDDTLNPEDIIQPTVSVDSTLWNLENDLNFLGPFCIPDVCNQPFPAAYSGMWLMVIEAFKKRRDFSRFALGLPRGHAKTTFLKLLIIFAILFTKKRFILVVGASATLAENILTDVISIMDSPNFVKIFGIWRQVVVTDRNDLKNFTFRGRKIILAAMGSGSHVRGFNLGNRRPDLIIGDDMQTAEEAQSPKVSKKLLRWFVGTLMKAKAPDGCTYLYVGNMYKDMLIGGPHSELYCCILRNLQLDSTWITWIVGGILADGTALWEEVQPLEQLLVELKSDRKLGQAEVFFAEVLNDPKGAGNEFLDLGLIPEYNINPDLDVKVGSFIMIDPSLGKKKSDAQVVMEFDVYDGRPIVTHLHIMQVDAPNLVKNCLKLAIAHRHPLIVAETAAYQATLLQWFEFIARQQKLEGIKFLPIAAKGRQKNSRILTWFKELHAGTSILHPRVQSQIHNQALAFEPLSTKNADDMLDTAAYGTDVVINYPRELMLPDILDLEAIRTKGVVENNCVFM